MSIAVTSPDISVLDFKVLFDMSLAVPRVTLTNLSTVTNANSLKWAFDFISALGTPIHLGETTFTAPDIDGVPFTTYTFTEEIPQPFRQLEFSKVNPYTITVWVQDSNGDIFSMTLADSLCKPAGNTGVGNFGKADIDIQAKCQTGKLLVTDKTNLIYKSLAGAMVSTDVKIRYPESEDGTTPADFISNQLPLLAPIINGGEGYGIYVAHIFDFETVPGFFVRVRFSYNNNKFAVWCNVDMCPLFCEYEKLLIAVEKDCDTETRAANNKKLLLINAKMLKAAMGLLQPLCDFDVPALIEEIKEIGGFTCDCCRPAGLASLGTAAIGSDLALNFIKDGGDINMNMTTDGNGNYTVHYWDKSYEFQMCAETVSEAFSIRKRTSQFTTNFCLNVDLLQLATEILTTIQGSDTLTEIINTIVTGGGGISACSINAMGLFTTSCDYVTELNAADPTERAIFIIIDGTTYTAPAGLLISQDSAVASWLNGLAKGTFTAIYSSVTKKTAISTTANTHTIGTITTGATTGNRKVFTFTNSCGNVCGILQSIINYLHDLNLMQIKIGGKVNVCKINGDGTVTTTPFLGNETAYQLAVALGEASCNATSYLANKGVSPENLKAQFSEYTNVSNPPVAGDYFFMSVNGKLIKMPLEKAALGMFSLLSSDGEVKSVYCQGAFCQVVNGCSPVTNLAVSANDTTAQATWTKVVSAIGYKYSIDGVNYTQINSTSIKLSGLTASATYSFRVYPVYNNGDGIECETTINFTTSGVGAACASVASFTADNITDNSARLTWAALSVASGYQYRLDGGAWINVGNVLQQGIAGLTAATTYTADIRAIVGGTPCSNVTSHNITTTLSEITIKNNLDGAAVDFVINAVKANEFNLLSTPVEATDQASITVPILGSSYIWKVRILTNIGSADMDLLVKHTRGASTLHSATVTIAGNGVETDMAIDASAFIVAAGDIFEVTVPLV